MSYLPYLYLFAYSGVQHILRCVFVSFFFILLQVSLDCPFLIAPSVFYNVYPITMFIYIYFLASVYTMNTNRITSIVFFLIY